MNLIIDGNNLAHRCKYKFDLSNNGIDVSITYGFFRVLTSVMQKLEATTTTVAWDLGIPEHRRTALPEYKANRTKNWEPEEYDDFIRQLEELHATLPTFGIVSIRKPACEADDIMYQAAKIYDGDSVILSNDMDMLQVMSDTVKVYNPNKELLLGPEYIQDEYGIPADQYLDWRALQGDSSDNIAGVMGIGPKTATKLLQKWGSLTALINACKTGKEDSKAAIGILSFGERRIYNNIYVMALYADRAGSRLEIIKNVAQHKRANRGDMKAYLVQNAFISLMTPDLFAVMLKQHAPEIISDIRTPLICEKRYPIED